MASKKSKTIKQPKPVEENPVKRSTRIMQVLFVILSVIIVLSMILSATATF